MSIDLQQLCYDAIRDPEMLQVLTDYLLENGLVSDENDNEKLIKLIYLLKYLVG